MNKNSKDKTDEISIDSNKFNFDEIIISSIKKSIRDFANEGKVADEIFNDLSHDFNGVQDIEFKILKQILLYDQNLFKEISSTTLNSYIFNDCFLNRGFSDNKTSKTQDSETVFREADEGNQLYVTHKTYERNSELPKMKKHITLEKVGSLKCEICDFDFYEKYGEHGKGFMECHHIYPVSKMEKGDKTKIDDLALVCANCHRMIHREKDNWLSLDEMKNICNGN